LRSLVTNADDFGFTRDVNEGIVYGYRDGILTATTIMATGAAFDHAVSLARDNPGLDIGVHLVLVGAEGFPPSVPRLLLSLATIRIYDLLPPVFSAMARIAREFGIPWIRRPFGPFRFQRPVAGVRTTDHFAGFRLTGKYDASTLAQLIRTLPEGSTEFMCHPGFCTPELNAARTRLKESRRRELDALTSPQVRSAIEESGVRLVSYRDL